MSAAAGDHAASSSAGALPVAPHSIARINMESAACITVANAGDMRPLSTCERTHVAEEEPKRKLSRGEAGAKHAKEAHDKRLAAIEAALQREQPLWSHEDDERDAHALVKAEELVGQVHLIIRSRCHKVKSTCQHCYVCRCRSKAAKCVKE